MKKIISKLFFLMFVCASIFAGNINDSQIIESDSEIYKKFLDLQLNAKKFVFTNNTPISVGELKYYFNQFNEDDIKNEALLLEYNQIYDFLYTNENLVKDTALEFMVFPRITLEGYYKTNDDIPWSFDYKFHDNLISMPTYIGFGNTVSFGANFFFGKNYIAAQKNDNFWNVPVNVNDISDVHLQEFNFPTFCFGSVGKTFDNWGYNINIGKQCKNIGQTSTGSILFNSTFETDAYLEFDVYSKYLKYTGDIIQVSSNRMDNIQQDNTERYLYIHQFDVRIFDNLKFSLVEGSLTANPLSIRFLNPLHFMHQYGGWTNYITNENKDIYRETNFCADFAYLLEYIPVKNLRLYGIYNQIEMQLPWERNNYWGKYYPNSIGLQFGADYNIFLKNSSKINLTVETFYNSPYMYIKQTPSSSLYRVRTDMQTKDEVYSWMGSPYGPDCIGGNFHFTYDSQKKWAAEFDYLFVEKGEIDFSIFNQTYTKGDEEYYDYYPSVEYKLKKDKGAHTDISNDDIYKEALNMKITGIPEYRNQFSVKGKYKINNNFELNGQLLFRYIINNKHIKNNTDFGTEAALSVTYNIF